MPRFFKENFAETLCLEGADASHISRSLRMRVGEELTVCDGKGKDFYCIIESLSPEKVCLSVKGEEDSQSEPDIEVTLCTCLLKGDKFEEVIKHSVELGAAYIQPVLSQNCVSRPDPKGMDKKLARWQKIALEAAGQSGRGKIPTVLPTVNLLDLAENLPNFDLTLFFYEGGGSPLGETVWENDTAKKIAVVTGPEGGFDPKEAEILAEKGAKTVSLGKRILRAETAPLAALTGIMLLTDNLEG